MKYCVSTDGERFEGDFDSAEDAALEGFETYDSDHLYVGEVVDPIAYFANPDFIGHRILEDISETLGEHIGECADSFHYTNDHAMDIGKLVLDYVKNKVDFGVENAKVVYRSLETFKPKADDREPSKTDHKTNARRHVQVVQTSKEREGMIMPLSKQVLAKYLNSIFVETGLGDGDGVRIADGLGFNIIYSIEIEQHRADAFKRKMQEERKDHITIICGDSPQELTKVISRHAQVPITFWLDAHPTDSPLPLKKCPLLAELNVIQYMAFKPTILIDDMRLFSQADRIIIEEAVRDAGARTILYEDSPVANGDIMVGIL